MIKLKLYAEQIISFLQIVQTMQDHVAHKRLATTNQEDRADLYVDAWELQQLSTLLSMKYLKLKQKLELVPINAPASIQLSPTQGRTVFVKYKHVKFENATPHHLLTVLQIQEPVFKQLTA